MKGDENKRDVKKLKEKKDKELTREDFADMMRGPAYKRGKGGAIRQTRH
jgi:hypothetical protein